MKYVLENLDLIQIVKDTPVAKTASIRNNNMLLLNEVHSSIGKTEKLRSKSKMTKTGDFETITIAEGIFVT